MLKNIAITAFVAVLAIAALNRTAAGKKFLNPPTPAA